MCVYLFKSKVISSQYNVMLPLCFGAELITVIPVIKIFELLSGQDMIAAVSRVSQSRLKPKPSPPH